MKSSFFNLQSSIVIISIMTLASCVQVPQEQHTSYETVEVTLQTITETAGYSSTLEGLTDALVAPRVRGHLMKKCVEEGQRVKAGDQLFLIDNRQAILEVNTGKANVQAAQAQLSTARLECESQQNLYDKGISSSYLLAEAKNHVQTAEANLAQAEANLEMAELDLSYHTITTPIDGIVGSIPYNVGELVDMSDVLTTISGTRSMIAKFSLNEEELSSILIAGGVDSILKTAPEVQLQLKNGQIHPYKGRIISISGVVNRITGAVSVRAQFPNPDGQLYSGVQGSVLIPITYDDIMIIPESAIVRLQHKTLVYTVQDSLAHATDVEIISLSNGKEAAVISGLNVGDKIVAVGAANVVDGQQVIF